MHSEHSRHRGTDPDDGKHPGQARQDRRVGQRDGATGAGIDEHVWSDPDYREGWQRGRAAECNRALTGWAGQRNHHDKAGSG